MICVAENDTNGYHMGVFSVDVAFACHFVQLSCHGKMCVLLLCAWKLGFLKSSYIFYTFYKGIYVREEYSYLCINLI